MNDYIIQHLEGFATTASVIAAIVLAIFGFLINHRRSKRQHTLGLITAFTTDPLIARADYVVHELCIKRIQVRYESVDEETRRNLRAMLVHYELLAHSYNEGIVDRRTIRKFRGRAMKELHALLKDYIADVRKNIGRPTLYGDYEKLMGRL